MEKQSIQILGSGCPVCKQLLKTVKEIATELKIEADIEHITDVAEMVKMGVMTSPVLAINGKPVLAGGGHNNEEIKKALANNLPQEKNDSCYSCGCCCKNC
ncbi:MAG: thioredoxin family protein [Candidatus Pacebacteria bacterium]|nr:thioredoxin family protein [Candidatus Paceibacterota bacterium]